MLTKNSKSKTKINTIIVGDIEVEVHRKNIKNFHLRIISPSGTVRLSVPNRTTDNAIVRLIEEKAAWIRAHQTTIKQRPNSAPQTLVSGECHPVWGQQYTLDVVDTKTKYGAKLTKANMLELSVSKDTNLQNRKRVLNRFYREQMDEALSRLLPMWEQRCEVAVSAVGIKNMKTKWGSCNIQARRVWLNLKKKKKPVECLEYVLVHELVHLYERYHNARFYSLMDKYLPVWRDRRDLLNRS